MRNWPLLHNFRQRNGGELTWFMFPAEKKISYLAEVQRLNKSSLAQQRKKKNNNKSLRYQMQPKQSSSQKAFRMGAKPSFAGLMTHAGLEPTIASRSDRE